MHLNEKQSQIMDFLRFDWTSRIREVSKNKTKLMPCTSMGPKLFWTNQIILVEYQLFWTGPICFDRVQIILDRSKLQKNSPEKSNLNLTKIGLAQNIWTCTKYFGTCRMTRHESLLSFACSYKFMLLTSGFKKAIIHVSCLKIKWRYGDFMLVQIKCSTLFVEHKPLILLS